MNNKFILVTLDDWEGLYCNNEIIEEGHRISREGLVALMKQHKVLDVDFKSLNEEGEKLVQDTGCMFRTYEEAVNYIP